ncbi:hypothetical protein PI125_g11911 [Phytophthora idaei]|nr:hypothetical protein PI125_g11911 [Phytophthora idaei]
MTAGMMVRRGKRFKDVRPEFSRSCRLPSLRGTFGKGDDDAMCHFGPTSVGQALRRDWRETWVKNVRPEFSFSRRFPVTAELSVPIVLTDAVLKGHG